MTTEQKLEIISSTISENTECSLQTLYKSNGKKNIRETKKLYSHFIRKYTNLRLKQIAKYLGRKDHATVISNIKGFDKLYETSFDFRWVANKIKKEIEVKLK